MQSDLIVGTNGKIMNGTSAEEPSFTVFKPYIISRFSKYMLELEYFPIKSPLFTSRWSFKRTFIPYFN